MVDNTDDVDRAVEHPNDRTLGRDPLYEREVPPTTTGTRNYADSTPTYRSDLASRGPERIERERYVGRPVSESMVQEKNTPRYSIGATFLGWCVASFLSLLLLFFVSGILGAAGYEMFQDDTVTTGEARTLTTMGAVGGLISVFLGYLIGGYTAGRIGLWRGAAHGAAVPLWAILFVAVVALLGATTAAQYFDAAGIAPPNIDLDNLAGPATIALILTVLAMFGGAILGGLWGERFDVEGHDWRDRRSGRSRTRTGRPL